MGCNATTIVPIWSGPFGIAMGLTIVCFFYIFVWKYRVGDYKSYFISCWKVFLFVGLLYLLTLILYLLGI